MQLSGVELKPLEGATGFRKMAMGAWRVAKDPSVYGTVEVDMKKSLDFLEDLNKRSGVKVRPVHLVGVAMARAFEEMPDMNGIIRGKRIYLRQSVDLFFQVNTTYVDSQGKTKANLAGATVRNADKMSAVDIAKALEEKAEKIKAHKDKEIQKSFDIMKWIPWACTSCFLSFMSFLMYGLNLNLAFLGIPRDPFGSVMITNVGSFGVEMAWAPLVPWSRVPMVLTVCAIKDRPVAVHGHVEVHPVMPVNVTFDHRFMDGSHAARMNKVFLECFANPEKYFS